MDPNDDTQAEARARRMVAIEQWVIRYGTAEQRERLANPPVPDDMIAEIDAAMRHAEAVAAWWDKIFAEPLTGRPGDPNIEPEIEITGDDLLF